MSTPSAQMRPLSPASESSAGDYFGRGGAAPRVCRALVVEAEAHESGVRCTVYCRIALPAFTQQAISLLTLTPLSHLLHHSTYELPLGPAALSASSSECLRAARLLGLSDATTASPSSVHDSRRTQPATRRRQYGIKLVQEDKVVSLVLEGPNSAPTSRSLSPTTRPSTPSPSAAPASRLRANSSGRKEQAEQQKEEKLEWILVLRLETAFGGLHEPKFANSVIVPLPICLRNSLAFTLPTTAESTSNSPPPQWDLAVKPSLRSSSSSTPPGDTDRPTTITGLFASTSALSIRWTPRRAYSVMLPESSLDVAWGIGENGWGRVTVKGEAQIEYAGLKDKTWVELKVDHGAGGLSESSTRAFEVLSLEGEGILAWEVAREAPAPVSPQPPRHPRLAREPSSEYTTPTPRPRPAAAHLQEAQSRPPSYSNLFDTAPPVAPDLDPAVVARMAGPSLLSQAAPFEGDASMDMTFEMSSSEGEDEGGARLLKSRLGTAEENVDGGGSATSSPEAPEADSDWPQAQLPFPTTTTIRLQLNLAALLVPEKLPTPTFHFELKADFPTITLRALSSAFYPSSEPYAFRLALPTFSLPAAVHEDTVVSVSAGVGGSVEVLASDPMLKGAVGTDADSPLPATNGRARWRTERSQDDGTPHRRSRSSSDLVEVEVSLPASRPTSLIQLDELGDSDEFSPSPSPAIRSPSRIPSLHRGQTPSLRSLRSKSSAHSLGLNLASAPLALAPTLGRLKLRITPVPPPLDSPTQPWRLFTHLTFPRPFVGSFELPMGEEQRVEVCDSWDAQGEAVLVESETLVEDARSGSGSGSGSASGSKRMRVDTTGSSRQSSPVLRRKGEAEAEVEGVHELLYVVETSQKGQDGKIELGDVLPKMDLKVSSMEVEVLPVAGYELLADKHAFDSATPPLEGASARFSKFQLPPSETSKLSVSLRPSAPPSPVVWAEESVAVVAERTVMEEAVVLPSPTRSPPPAPLPAFEPPASPVAPAPPSPALSPSPPTPHSPTAAQAPVSAPPNAPATPPPVFAPIKAAPSPTTPARSSTLSTVLSLSPILIFLFALAFAHWSTPGGLSSLTVGEKGPWPSFDAEGELVLLGAETGTFDAPRLSASETVSMSTTTTTLTSVSTVWQEATAAPTATPTSSSAARTLTPSPAAPRPTYIDDFSAPPPAPAEAEPQLGVEEAGFPDLLAEIVASWQRVGREVGGWFMWVRGWVGL